MITSDFSLQHIGISENNIHKILKEINASSANELISQSMPKNILGQEDLELPKAISEYDMILLSKYLAS